MSNQLLTNPIVKAAIDALQTGGRKAWTALFEPDAELWSHSRVPGIYDAVANGDISLLINGKSVHDKTAYKSVTLCESQPSVQPPGLFDFHPSDFETILAQVQ